MRGLRQEIIYNKNKEHYFLSRIIQLSIKDFGKFSLIFFKGCYSAFVGVLRVLIYIIRNWSTH